MAVMNPITRGRALGNATLQFLGPTGFGNLANLSPTLTLKTLDWCGGMNDPATSYPSNPYTMCPRLQLRMMTQDITPGPPQGGQAQDAVYKFSLFYQRRQTMGEPHQILLIDDLEIICNRLILFKMYPPEIEAVEGFSNFKSYPASFIVHNDLRHDFDDPNLRISVGEINYALEGRLAAYLLT